jgi:hypothetical protein
MLKNITFSADDALIEAARALARAEKTTLNEKVRGWLEAYVRDKTEGERRVAAFRDVMEKLKHIDSGGRKFTRDEMNERR